MEFVVKVECSECGFVTRIGRYDKEECYCCGKDLHEEIANREKKG